MTLHPVNRRRDGGSLRRALPDEAATYVRDLILSGQLRPGEYIRAEPLAEALGISPTPVREALLAVRGEGLVQQEPRRGFLVAPLAPEDIQDVFLVQSWVAGELAARAATKLDELLLARLKNVQQGIVRAYETQDPQQAEQLNYEFHREINLLGSSNKLMWLLKATARYAPSYSYGSISGWPRSSVDDHPEILDALESRDPELVRTAMETHVRKAGTLLVQHLKDNGFWLADTTTEISTESPPSASRLCQVRTAEERPPASASPDVSSGTAGGAETSR